MAKHAKLEYEPALTPTQQLIEYTNEFFDSVDLSQPRTVTRFVGGSGYHMIIFRTDPDRGDCDIFDDGAPRSVALFPEKVSVLQGRLNRDGDLELLSVDGKDQAHPPDHEGDSSEELAAVFLADLVDSTAEPLRWHKRLRRKLGRLAARS
jgi:hypothetical protein